MQKLCIRFKRIKTRCWFCVYANSKANPTFKSNDSEIGDDLLLSRFPNQSVSKQDYFQNSLLSWQDFECKASLGHMESGHGKGPCDPIDGTAKRKTDQAVKTL